MTIYGETPDQFRPRPSAGTLATFSIGVTLLAAWLAALITAAVTMAATGLRLAGDVGFPLFLAPAGTLFLPGTTALVDDPRLAAGPVVLLLLALLLLTFWPTGASLGSRLSVRMAARTFALAALTSSLTLSPMEWLAGELSATGMWRPAIALAALLVLWRGELSVRNLLGSVFDVATPQRRFGLWLLVSLPQYAAWALLAGAQQSSAGVWTALYAVIVGVLAATAGSSRTHWEHVDRPRMVEDSIMAIASGVLVSAIGFAIFGLPALSHPSHAVIFSTDPIARRMPLEVIRLTNAEGAVETEGTDAEGGAEDGSVIEIRWSDPERARQRPPSAAPERAPATATQEP